MKLFHDVEFNKLFLDIDDWILLPIDLRDMDIDLCDMDTTVGI